MFNFYFFIIIMINKYIMQSPSMYIINEGSFVEASCKHVG